MQYQLASLLYEEARYVEALQAYAQAARTRDSGLGIRALKGSVRSALKVAEFGLARQAAQKLVGQAQADAEAQTLLADTLWSAGLFDEADRAYKSALAIAPDNPRARFGIARSLATQSKLSSALDEALAASALSPRDGDIHAAIGDIYERMNRFDEAANSYSNYINLLPNKDRSEKAAWARAQVQFLESFEGLKPLDVDEEDLRMLHTIPFRLVKDKVIVQARVNGSRAMDFTLDTEIGRAHV